MTESDFRSNSKLFAEVESVRQAIREDIHNKCRNSTEGPSANTESTRTSDTTDVKVCTSSC